MGNIVNTVKRFSKVTVEAASASKGGSIDGCKAFSEEVTNEGMHMAPSSTSTKGCIGDTDLFRPLVHTKPSGCDEANKERETPNGAVHTDARELGCVDLSEKTGLIYSETSGHMLHSLEDESTGAPRSIIMLDISKDSLSEVSPEGNSSRNPNLADDVENTPATDAHSGKKLILPRGSPADGLFDCNVCKDLADGALDSGYKSSAEVSLEGQRHEKRTQGKSLNYDVVPIEAITPCANSGTIGLKSNAKSSSKGQAKRKRTTKSSRKMSVPKEGVGTLVPLDMICLENEEQPTGPLAQSLGDKVLQGTPRSRKTRTPLSYVHESPLTRSKGKELSVSTPESVKMKRSRSGRLIVPRLDPGTQNIIYDPDGSICAITNLEVQFPQGISSEPPSKRRKSRRLSPVYNRLLTF